MSVTPPAIERSVLERKEREELAAIAGAMGVKTNSRASKATLIDHILREAGVESAAAAPRRGRTAPAAAAMNSVDAGPVVSTNGSLAVESGANSSYENGSAPDNGAAAANVPAILPAPGGPDSSTDNKAGRQPAPRNDSDHGSPPGAGGESGGSPGGSGDGGPGRNDNRQRDRRSRDQRGSVNQSGESSSFGDSGPNSSQGSGSHQGPQSGGDVGNRRGGRRRRGRDRSVPGGERELQPERAESEFSGEPVAVDGLLDLREEGYGFLRTSGYLATGKDVYVSLSQVRKFGLRKGDFLKGTSRPAATTEKYPALLRIETVNDMTVEEARGRVRFEELTPLFPDEKLRLEVPGDSANMVARIVDLISPVGKGQRGLIVSPPKAGKTTVLKQIAHSIEANNPDVHLMVLLVDERPEEVTDMRRSVRGEVIASTFDRPSDEHTQVVELAIERAKRLVEQGRDVVIVLDGITRLARAYNLAAPATGRIMSGGIDTGALYPPKKFFGAARNLEEGGSLTILATALIETGSKMDEVIFEEFKGTGNMELRLDRRLAERRIYPAIDVNASSTRHEELLFERGQLQQVWKLRRVLNGLEGGAGLELLMDKIKTTKSNDEFLAEIAKAPAPAV